MAMGLETVSYTHLDVYKRQSLHYVEFGLTVFELGVQTLRDGLCELAGIIHDYQPHAVRGLMVHQKNNQQAERQADQRDQDCSNDEALRLDAG